MTVAVASYHLVWHVYTHPFSNVQEHHVSVPTERAVFQSVMLRMVQCKYDHTDLESEEDLSIAPLPIAKLVSESVMVYTCYAFNNYSQYTV